MAIKEQLILEGVNKTDGAFRGVNRNVKELNTGFSTLQKSLIGIGVAINKIRIRDNKKIKHVFYKMTF